MSLIRVTYTVSMLVLANTANSDDTCREYAKSLLKHDSELIESIKYFSLKIELQGIYTGHCDLSSGKGFFDYVKVWHEPELVNERAYFLGREDEIKNGSSPSIFGMHGYFGIGSGRGCGLCQYRTYKFRKSQGETGLAISTLILSSSHGIQEANVELGQILLDGKLVEKDVKQALACAINAADKGSVRAKKMLGKIKESHIQ